MRQVNDSIFYADEQVIKVNRQDVEFLKEKALVSKTVRSRLCMHKDVDALLHEMFIVHFRDTYVRPHKHLTKSESIHMILGVADLIIFDNEGEIREIVSLGDYNSGKCFYYRMDEDFYSTILIDSDTCIFHETTKGPFDRQKNTIPATWSPAAEEKELVKKYMNDLRERKEVFNSRRLV